MEGMQNNTQATLFGLSAVILWSTVATAFSLSLKYLSPTQLLLIANLVSIAFLFALIIVKKEAKELAKLAKQSWKRSICFGLISPCIYYLVLLEAYDRLPAQEAQAINYTWAIMLSLLSIPTLKQRLKLTDYIAALLCYFGVLYIATRGQITSLEFSNILGVGLALLSTIIWALYWLFNTKDKRPSLIALTLNFSFALPFVVIYAALSGELSNWNSKGIWGAVYVGFFEMGLSFVLWNQALKLSTHTSRIANLIFISPLLSIVWLSQFANESILTSTLVGLACILVGLFIQNTRIRRT